MNREEIENKLKEEGLTNEEQIQLRGKLIRLLKDAIKETKDQKELLPLKLKLYDELKKHKETLQKRGKEESISIPKRVGLKVNEIATTISILKEKMDFGTKIKTTAISTTISSLIVGAITVGMTALGGAPITLATLAATIPTICYCGISGLIRMPFTSTAWSKFLDSIDKKDENQKKIIEFLTKEVKEDQELIGLLKKKGEKPSEAELIEINNKLITKYQKLIDKAPVSEISKLLTFEKINIMTEQKRIYEKIKQEYIKSKREMTVGEFAELEKGLIAIDLGIAKENVFLKEVLKESGKDLAISGGSVIVARAIMSFLFPEYAISSIAQLSTPLLMTLLGNAANMGSLKDKIALEKEAYDKLKTNITKELLERLQNQNGNKALARA